jgi:hypothetical protein
MSSLIPPRIAAATLRLFQSAPTPATIESHSDRVKLYPSPNGVVRIVGTTSTGAWVAEHTCYASDFCERHVDAMHCEVLRKEAAAIYLMK